MSWHSAHEPENPPDENDVAATVAWAVILFAVFIAAGVVITLVDKWNP